MTIGKKWILATIRTPELKYRNVYSWAEDGDIAEELESDEVLILTANGERGYAFYHAFRYHGEQSFRKAFYGVIFRVEETEYGSHNTELSADVIENVYAWQRMPGITDDAETEDIQTNKIYGEIVPL